MNWSPFKDPVSHMCLAGAVAASRSVRQEVAGSNVLYCIFSLNSLKLVKHLGKTQLLFAFCH